MALERRQPDQLLAPAARAHAWTVSTRGGGAQLGYCDRSSRPEQSPRTARARRRQSLPLAGARGGRQPGLWGTGTQRNGRNMSVLARWCYQHRLAVIVAWLGLLAG